MTKSKIELFYHRYGDIIEELSGKTHYDFCLSYSEELKCIDGIDRSISILMGMIKEDNLNSRMNYISGILSLDNVDFENISVLHLNMKLKVDSLLFHDMELAKMTLANNEMTQLLKECIASDNSDDRLSVISDVVNNKLYKDACLYTKYLSTNIMTIYKFYIYSIDTLLYFHYELLVFELISYIDEVIGFLNTIYSFYSLSNKSVLTYKLITELEKFRDYHTQKLVELYI